MTYRPGSHGGAYGGRRKAASPPRPAPDRRAWLMMLERAQEAVQGDVSDRHLDFTVSLKGLAEGNFPVGQADVRRKWAKTFVDRAWLWLAGGVSTRTAFGPALATDAKALMDILIEQGSAEAQASRARMGFKED